jgi:hypothetical protein
MTTVPNGQRRSGQVAHFPLIAAAKESTSARCGRALTSRHMEAAIDAERERAIPVFKPGDAERIFVIHA